MTAAHRVGASVPMGASAEALYQLVVDAGGAERNFSSIVGLLDGRLPDARHSCGD